MRLARGRDLPYETKPTQTISPAGEMTAGEFCTLYCTVLYTDLPICRSADLSIARGRDVRGRDDRGRAALGESYEKISTIHEIHLDRYCVLEPSPTGAEPCRSSRLDQCRCLGLLGRTLSDRRLLLLLRLTVAYPVGAYA